MTAVAVQIAAEMVTALNDHTFSRPFTAVRAYVPAYKLEDMDTLHVTAVPAEYDGAPSDRTRDKEEHVVHVAVQQRFRPTEGAVALTDVDGLMGLCEEIRDFMRNQTFAGARRVQTTNKPIFDPKHLQEFHQFTGLLAFTFRVVR